jgi:hypothetical protein
MKMLDVLLVDDPVKLDVSLVFFSCEPMLELLADAAPQNDVTFRGRNLIHRLLSDVL